MKWIALSVLACFLGVAGLAAAQEPPSAGGASAPPPGPRPLGMYAGVAPGQGGDVPAAARARGPRRILTWPGFQAMPDGRSTFFLQTSQPVQTETRREDGRVVVVLKDTRVQLRNNQRPLETEFFTTPVRRARVERRGRDVVLIMELRAGASGEPSVRSEAGPAGNLVLIEFAPWSAPSGGTAGTAQ